VSDRRAAVWLFVLVFVAYAWFFGGAGWNQNSTFDLTRALVEQQTIRIDGFPPNTGDYARVDGRIYSNKPPGLSLLAAIPYALAYAVESDPAAPMTQIRNLYFVTVTTCATTGALLIAAFFLYARGIGASRVASLAVSLALAFGTYLFAFSTLFFAHVPSACFLFLSFALARKRPLLSGTAAGLAVLCNYTSVLALPAIALLVVAGRGTMGPMGQMDEEHASRPTAQPPHRPTAQLLRWAAGGAPFALILGAYHQAAFGSPFKSATEMQNPMFNQQELLFGFLGIPKLSVLYELTFGPYRGLFFLSPVLLAAFAGAFYMAKRKELRRELAAIAFIVVSLFLMNASFNGWHGGAAIGPRYILSVVPFLGVLMLFAPVRLRSVWIALAVVSFAFNFVAVAVNPMPSWKIERPVDRYLIPLFVTGRLGDEPLTNPVPDWKLMLGHVSVLSQAPDEGYPFMHHPAGSRESFWSSFNLGELLWPGSPLSTLPVLLWIGGGALRLLRTLRVGRIPR
jgi:hypothetical protein